MAESARPVRDRYERAAKGRSLAALGLLWTVLDRFAATRLFLAVLLVVGSSILVSLAPAALGSAVDALSADSSAGPGHTVVFWLLAYVLAHAFAKALGELRWRAYGGAEQRAERLLNRHVFRHVLALPMSFHLERKTGAIAQVLANGMTGYRLILQHLVFTVTPALAEIATMAMILAAIGQPVLLAILGISMLSYGLAFLLGVLRITGPARAAAAVGVDSKALMTDSLLNCETVKYYGAEGLIGARLDDVMKQVEQQWDGFFRRRVAHGLVVTAIFGTTLGASAWLAGSEVVHGKLTIGDFVLVNLYVLQAVRPIELIGLAFRDLTQALVYIEQQMELLAQAREPHEQTGVSPHTARGGAELRFDGVSFSYPPGDELLRGVNLVVPSGRTLGIVGPSGSGKSSLIRLLFRFYEPASGRILLDGTPIAAINLAALRTTFGVVPQDTVLFNDTIEYNIRFGSPNCSPDEVVRAARLAGLHDFLAHLPAGYRTVVGERGLKLSAGERQRVAIARAVLKKPRVFVFDEATSSLDTRTERAILRNLIVASSGTTTLMIAHRLSTVAHADEIIVLDGGSVVERGTHGELLRQGRRYAAMWRAQDVADTAKEHDALRARPETRMA